MMFSTLMRADSVLLCYVSVGSVSLSTSILIGSDGVGEMTDTNL